MTLVDQYLQERKKATACMLNEDEKGLQECNQRSEELYAKFTKSDFEELIKRVNGRARHAFEKAMQEKYPD